MIYNTKSLTVVINPFPSLGDSECWFVSESRAPVVLDRGCTFELLRGLLKPLDTQTQNPDTQKPEPLGEGPWHLYF